MKTTMVIGFCFDSTMQNVALILKNKPEWQKGCLNGIGGKKEDRDNYSYDVMIREFQEETGVKTIDENWNQFAILAGLEWLVYCFYCKDTAIYDAVRTTESEEIIKISVSDLSIYKTIRNLQWLIPLAIDCDIESFRNKPFRFEYCN